MHDVIDNADLPPLVGDRAAARHAAIEFPVCAQAPAQGFFLRYEAGGLTLQHSKAAPNERGLCLDFCDTVIRRRAAGGRKSPLARAVGLRRHPDTSILDATCGLGRDSATLAALGATVTSIERHPVLFALLEDARERARAACPLPAWLPYWRSNIHADAIGWLDSRPRRPIADVVYIDPMFDAARRKARPQKALAWLNALVGSDSDAAALLAAARPRAGRQVVVKQHARSAPLAPPDRTVEGKAIRFDIYLADRAGI